MVDEFQNELFSTIEVLSQTDFEKVTQSMCIILINFS